MSIRQSRLPTSAARWTLYDVLRALLLALAFVALAVIPALSAERACAVDGDTLRLGGINVDGRCQGGMLVRLHGVDAPELQHGEPGGQEALTALQHLVNAGPLACQHVDFDAHGRSISTCSVAGRDLGAVMVGSGRALACPRFTRRYDTIEAEAARRRLGLWATKAYQRKPYCLPRDD